MEITNLPEAPEHVFDEATFKLLQEKVLSALHVCRDEDVRKELIEIAGFMALEVT